jgi:indolepyruvate ferredoxin oxidoreductase alpha subunit
MKKLLIGNEAIARGAWEAGVRVSAAYPGTPSTETSEFLAHYPEVAVEWSPNEKVAAEVAYGAAVAGARAMTVMKHVGLNVAADSIFTAAYTGINAGFVVMVADDPGMNSSQNEQDSRYYGQMMSLPVLEPSDADECRKYMKIAFELSERYDTPVILRSATRVSHCYGVTEIEPRQDIPVKPYVKNDRKYAMMPLFARPRHIEVEKRINRIAEDIQDAAFPAMYGVAFTQEFMKSDEIGFVTNGACFNYVSEAFPDASVMKLGITWPMPISLIEKFASKVKRLVVCEEGDGIIEKELKAAGIACEGKNIFGLQAEFNVANVKARFKAGTSKAVVPAPDTKLPARIPVMCKGCGHGTVYEVFAKMGLTVVADIGCYSLGALAPYYSIDTIGCMGTGASMPHGFYLARRDENKKTIGVLGDSTFAHNGITGLIHAVYNKSNYTLVILDNSTTGMTGGQENPTTGITLQGETTHALDCAEVARACGVKDVRVVDAYDKDAVETNVQQALDYYGVSVIVARRPCMLLLRRQRIAKGKEEQMNF